ncbi:MAG: DUF4832 domain-containing protein [Flavobacterium sp.]
MKNCFTLVFWVLIFYGGFSQNLTTVNYVPSQDIFPNPERGFYRYSEARASNYQLLNQNTLLNYRNNQNISLVFRYFYLNTFFNSNISTTYLNNMQTDFNRLRNAGLKCVIRFAYSDSEDASPLDATKSRILSHITQLKPILEANSDVIALVQAGFIGAWGEWYYTSQAEFGGWGFNQTNLTASNYNHRKDIVNALMNAVPSNRMIQIRYPRMKQMMYNTNVPLPPSSAFTNEYIARLGHHNDCFLSSPNDVGTYSNINLEYPYLEQETRFLPMGGETCAVYEPRTNCSTALFEMGKFHWSYLNLDYFPAVIQNFQQNDCFEEMQRSLGYRFELIQAQLPQNTNAGSTFQFQINLRNTGFAAPYNERTAYVVLKNLSTNDIHSFPLESDPRHWIGNDPISINETITLPDQLVPGTYKMYLHLPDASSTIAQRPEYAIRLANQDVWESATGFNSLNHNLIVNQTLGVSEVNQLSIGIYPVPTNQELTIEFDQIHEFKIHFFNSLGQQIQLPTQMTVNKMLVNTESLSNGIYFISFDNGTVSDTKKFVVRR